MANSIDLQNEFIHEERLFLYALAPAYIVGGAGAIYLVGVVVAKRALWKPRHIFQVK